MEEVYDQHVSLSVRAVPLDAVRADRYQGLRVRMYVMEC
jgi:hypothetical protein